MLVPIENPPLMASSILSYLEHPDKAEGYAKVGLEAIDRFSVARAADAYIGLIGFSS